MKSLQIQKEISDLFDMIEQRMPEDWSLSERFNEKNRLWKSLTIDNPTKEQLFKEVLFILVDGIRFGNWPWTEIKHEDAIRQLVKTLEHELAPIDFEQFCGQHFNQDLHSSQSSCALCGLRETVHLRLECVTALRRNKDEYKDVV